MMNSDDAQVHAITCPLGFASWPGGKSPWPRGGCLTRRRSKGFGQVAECSLTGCSSLCDRRLPDHAADRSRRRNLLSPHPLGAFRFGGVCRPRSRANRAAFSWRLLLFHFIGVLKYPIMCAWGGPVPHSRGDQGSVLLVNIPLTGMCRSNQNSLTVTCAKNPVVENRQKKQCQKRRAK